MMITVKTLYDGWRLHLANGSTMKIGYADFRVLVNLADGALPIGRATRTGQRVGRAAVDRLTGYGLVLESDNHASMNGAGHAVFDVINAVILEDAP